MKKDEFCKKLKQLRTDTGMTQKDVAEALGIPLSAVSLIESGQRRIDIFELMDLLSIYKKDLRSFVSPQPHSGGKRWYDNSPTISEAMRLLQQAPEKLQKASAMGVIGFLQEFDNRN